MSLVECYSFFSINFGYISDPLPNVKFPALFQHKFPTHWLYVEHVWGWQKTIKTSFSLRSAVFVGSLMVFIPCSCVLLLTLNRFLLRRTFWFLVLVWKETCPKSLFKSQEQCLQPALIPLLSTLDRFSSSYLYVLFYRTCSVISVLPCTAVEVATLCSGPICTVIRQLFKYVILPPIPV